MNASDFDASLSAEQPPAALGPLPCALWYERRGDWQRAHAIVQGQNGAAAAAVHAYLHRKEGDLGNADYWYARAGKVRPQESLEREWHELVAATL